MKLNLSNFRKIESSDNITILEHPNKHQIKISHKGLSPEYRKELEDLPLHKAKGRKISFKEFSKNYEASKASKPSESSNTMPGSPTDAKKAYTEPQDIGTKGYTDKGNYNDVALAALHKESPPFGPLGTAPKQHYPPCINPSCKSYGHPHPNCRCYGGMSEHTGAGEAGYFAEGGKVGESHFCSEDRMHETGCQYFAEGTDKPVAPMTAPSPADTMEQEEQPQQQPIQQLSSQPQMNNNVESPSSQPEQQSPPAQEPGPEPISDAYQNAYNIMTKEHADFVADKNAGHIQPKTYSDLFNKNPDDTDRGGLSKIGTLFGLLIGGAGSGLTHQPNVVLQMMDNEINRDVAAQEASQKNRQSFMSINGHNLQSLANAGKIGQDTRAMQFATTKAMTSYAYWDKLAQYANSLPPGTDAYNKAQQQLILAKDAMDKNNASSFAQAAAANAISAQQNPSPANQSGINQPGVNYDRLKQLRIQSQTGAKGVPTPADISSMDKESANFDRVEKTKKDFLQYMDYIHNQVANGALKKNQMGAIKSTLAAKIAPIVGMNNAPHDIKSVLPEWSDLGPETYNVKKNAVQNMFNVMQTGYPVSKQWGVIKEAPMTSPNATTKQEGQSQNKPITATNQFGHKITKNPKTGKWE